jgi:hypothetical protein
MPDDQRVRLQIGSLRETAAQLDGSANRLETLELYQQADALRNVAQRLRLEARSMARRGPPAWDAPTAAPQGAVRPVRPTQPTAPRRVDGGEEAPQQPQTPGEGMPEQEREPTPEEPPADNGA